MTLSHERVYLTKGVTCVMNAPLWIKVVVASRLGNGFRDPLWNSAGFKRVNRVPAYEDGWIKICSYNVQGDVGAKK